MENAIIATMEDRHRVKLRDFQSAVCRKVLLEEDIFVCAPTGSGKTCCFAFIHELFELRDGQSGQSVTNFSEPRPGPKKFIAIVISPLPGLMVEQAERLCNLGIDAIFIGELQTDTMEKQRVVRDDFEVLFITPEAIFHSSWRAVLSSANICDRIRAVVIDEAHCISHWWVKLISSLQGSSFRKGHETSTKNSQSLNKFSLPPQHCLV